jgi:hypothetical protein
MWIIQNLGQAVIQFLAGLDSADAHQAIAAGQFIAGADDLIDRAGHTKA